MANLRLTDINHGAALLKQIVRRADLNKDGAIRTGDINAIREHANVAPATDGNWNNGSDGAQLISGINSAVGRAKSRGGPQLTRVNTAIDELKGLVRGANVDGNTTLSPTEQRKLKTTGEKGFLNFVIWAKDKSIGDIDLPAAHDPARPRFKWTGAPAEVCQSLLDAHSQKTNDNFWPSWGSVQDGPSRYVINGAEARAMVTALGQLYVRRQKSVLTVLADRTANHEFGCVSPNAAGKRVLEAYATSLGLDLEFHQPTAPRMPNP